MRYVVRIITQGVGDFDQQVEHGPFLDVLRRAGLVQVHRASDAGTCFDLLPPASVQGHGNKAWATRTAATLEALHVNAVCAPEFPVPGSETKPSRGTVVQVCERCSCSPCQCPAEAL